jgi:Transposase DDE domain group 1
MNAYDPQAYTILDVDSMQSEMAAPLHLAPVGDKAVDLDFDGGLLSSDAGLVLLKDPDEQLGLTRALAAVLKDARDPRRVHFPLHDLLKQRVLQIAVVSLNCCDEVLSAEYHNIRASQGMKVS